MKINTSLKKYSEYSGRRNRTGFLLNTLGMLVYVTDVRSDVRRSEDSARSNIPGSRAKIFTNVRELPGGCRRKRRKKTRKRRERQRRGDASAALSRIDPPGEFPPFYFHLLHLSLLFPRYNGILLRRRDYSSGVPIFPIACAVLSRGRD